MFNTSISPPAKGLADRLARRAETLARARAEEQLRANRKDPWRWRKAGLLWPLF
ncbi:MAG: hypothetical protein R3E21_05700 [Caenibius sp.]